MYVKCTGFTNCQTYPAITMATPHVAPGRLAMVPVLSLGTDPASAQASASWNNGP
jgi:hypothetical protein